LLVEMSAAVAEVVFSAAAHPGCFRDCGTGDAGLMKIAGEGDGEIVTAEPRLICFC